MTPFSERLHRAVREKQTPALVGLDPRIDQLPAPVLAAAGMRRDSDEYAYRAAAFEEFCFRLIEVVAPLVPAVKPQAAFFEELGPAGCRVLARVVRRARDRGLIVIMDAKRGDIGSTAEAYARAYLAGEDPEAAAWAADALTVNPYLGADTLEPFVDVAVERGAGIYVLVRTSNPGAGTIQDRRLLSENATPSDSDDSSEPMYHHVARVVEEISSRSADDAAFGPVGAVVGATWPSELAALRHVMPHCPLLVPGYGSQGGTSSDVVSAFNADGLGALVNSSRAINFAFSREPYNQRYSPEQWEQAAEDAAREMIDDLAGNTPAGALRGSAKLEDGGE